MNTPYIEVLLRRTAVALAAAAGFCLPISASAQTLQKSTGETVCNYSSLTINVGGAIVVTCAGVGDPPPPPPGESFSITAAPTTLGVNQSALVLATRNGTASGVAAINYTISGGCQPASGTFWIGTTRPTEGFQITAPATGGVSCTVALTSTSAGTLAAPFSTTVSVPATQQVPGCPAVPADVLDFDLKLSGADILRMSSGRIGSAVLPRISDTRSSSASGQILFGESTVAPRNATVEISVSKCRGEINPSAGFCYMSSSSTAFLKMEWVETVPPRFTDAHLNQYRLCKALTSEGPWYANIRYTFSQGSCLWGEGVCGFVNQWNYGGF